MRGMLRSLHTCEDCSTRGLLRAAVPLEELLDEGDCRELLTPCVGLSRRDCRRAATPLRGDAREGIVESCCSPAEEPARRGETIENCINSPERNCSTRGLSKSLLLLEKGVLDEVIVKNCCSPARTTGRGVVEELGYSPERRLLERGELVEELVLPCVRNTARRRDCSKKSATLLRGAVD